MEEYNLEESSAYSYDIEVKTIDTSEYLDERQRKASRAGEYEDFNRNITIITPNEILEEEHCNTRFNDVIKTDKYKYIGEIVNNKRDGFGICYYNRGEIYIGNFINDKKEGFGKTLFPNGDINQGELKENHYEGFCEYFNEKKQISIQGYVMRGRFVDEIIIIHNGRTIYTGLVKKIIFKNYFFIGECDYNMNTAFGISVFENFIYQGNIIENKFNGYGEIYYPDGSRFYGFFKENKKNGFGFLLTKDGKINFGNYEDDYKEGAFFTISKSNFKMEIYHLGFKAKFIEKFENSKKFLINYPEYTYILKLNYKPILEKLEKYNQDEYSTILAELSNTDPVNIK